MRAVRTIAAVSLLTIIVAGPSTLPRTGVVFAHESRDEGDYRFVVGFLHEPAYEGERNGVSLRVTKLKPDDHEEPTEEESTGKGERAHDEAETVPVEGIEATVQVEVTHVPSRVTKTMNLRAVWNEPGLYAADLIPTSPGHYRFRFFGTIEGNEIDSTYDSIAGGGDFDDVQPASAIQFPEAVASGRELEAAVRGARTTAEQAQETAARVEDNASGGSTLGIIGIALGAAGVALGGGAMLMTMSRRKS